MTSDLDDLLETLGRPFLRWVSNLDDDELDEQFEESSAGGTMPNPTLQTVVMLASQGTSQAGAAHMPASWRWGVFGSWIEADRTVLANALRLQSGGDLPEVKQGADDVINELRCLARDAAPLALIPPTPWDVGVLSVAYQHPGRTAFQDAVMDDPDLKRLFPSETDHGGPVGSNWRSTGSGGSQQLWMFADNLLSAAATRLRLDECLDPENLMAAAVEELETVREALRGRPVSVPARVAFTNILLPEGRTIVTPWGDLRPTTPAEMAVAPEALHGQTSHTYREDDHVTVNFSGDVILVGKLPYAIKLENEQGHDAVEFPAEFVAIREQGQSGETLLRTAITLALPGNFHAAAIPTWRLVHDPLAPGMQLSWHERPMRSDPPPRQLTEQDCAAIEEMVQALFQHHSPKIDIALTRLQTAMTERTYPADRLIDATIAWENLFGSLEGELRMRISTALAWLLEPTDVTARKHLRDEAKALYDSRSNVVHANARGMKKRSLDEDGRRALELGLHALRVLYVESPALIDDDHRGATLLLGR